ncbi:MAG: SUMF1/EgtB/PvdO family nonheme iron enzyme [Bacteroidetes Order II. Incertae sedis bacterium]|nr:SUMF1/EgtB/PvdO family nonheme iron enzyme [Bacteroidetes Order II. bacterium]
MKQTKKLVIACLLIGILVFVPASWAQKKPSGSKPVSKPATTPARPNTTPARPTPTPAPNRNTPAARPVTAPATSRPEAATSTTETPTANRTVNERTLTINAVESCEIRINGGPAIAIEAGKPQVVTLQRQNNDVQVIVPGMNFSWTQRAPRVNPGKNVDWELDMSRLYAERLRRLDEQRILAEETLRRQQRVADSLLQVQRNAQPTATNTPVPPPSNTQTSANNTVLEPPRQPEVNPTNTASVTSPQRLLPPVERVTVNPPVNPVPGQTWENSLASPMVWVPAGVFRMGGNASFDQRPVHPVDLARGVWMNKFEVTQAEWEAVMGSNPSFFKDPKKPIENVSYEEVQLFIARLNEREGTTTYRLPTEAEWEYGARAGSSRAFAWGNDVEKGRANCKNCGSRFDGKETAPVGSFFPNAFGLYDVHGNVSEWVQDWYSEEYYKLPEASRDPIGPQSGTARVIRGGSFDLPGDELRVFVRGSAPPMYKSGNLGFRLVKVIN